MTNLDRAYLDSMMKTAALVTNLGGVVEKALAAAGKAKGAAGSATGAVAEGAEPLAHVAAHNRHSVAQALNAKNRVPTLADMLPKSVAGKAAVGVGAGVGAAGLGNLAGNLSVADSGNILKDPAAAAAAAAKMEAQRSQGPTASSILASIMNHVKAHPVGYAGAGLGAAGIGAYMMNKNKNKDKEEMPSQAPVADPSMTGQTI